MAVVTSVDDGDWVADAATVWDGGVVPALGDTVVINGHHVDIANGETTNEIAGLTATAGTLHGEDGGILDLAGLATFDAGDTFIMEGGFDVRIVCTADNEAGRYVYIYAGTITVQNATKAKPAQIFAKDNTKRPNLGCYLKTPAAATSIDGLEVYDCYGVGFRTANCTNQPAKLENIWVHDCVLAGIDLQNSGRIEWKNIAAYSCASGLSVTRGIPDLKNAVFGEDLDGGAAANSSRDIILSDGLLLGDFLKLSSTTQVVLSGSATFADIANFGCIVSDGIITGSGTPGDRKRWQDEGTIEWDGTDCTLTPNSNCSATFPLRCNMTAPPAHCAQIPATGGDAITLSSVVTVNASQTADTTTLVLDPDSLYGCNDTSTENTPQSTTTTITAGSSLTAGSHEVQVPWEVRISAYAAGGAVTVDSLTGTVAGARLELDRDKWFMTLSSADPGPFEAGAWR